MNFLQSFASKMTPPLLLMVAFLGASPPAHAGQGFFFSFDTSALTGAVSINDLDYQNWYPGGIGNGVSIQNNAAIYTEQCQAFFGCGNFRGNQSLLNDGLEFNLYINGAVAFQICLSYSGPIASTTNCATGANPQSSYEDWIAGCYSPNGHYSCTVAEVGLGAQIAVHFVLAPVPEVLGGESNAPEPSRVDGRSGPGLP